MSKDRILSDEVFSEIFELNFSNLNNSGKCRLLLKDEEDRLSPIDVMFMYKVLERIGNLADNAHHIGEKFSLMLVSL